MADSALLREDKVRASLCKLYEACGYRAFRMRKFEEYSLYLENQSFLTSKYAITFNDLDGRLLALKPDVTLSIVKHSKADEKVTEKLYYAESVYRVDKRTREYKEIHQVGLELLGRVDDVSLMEVASLALRSLEEMDSHYVMEFSHMGFLSGVLESIGVDSEARRKELLECMGAKNSADLELIAKAAGVSDNDIESLAALTKYCTDYREALANAKALAVTKELEQQINDLENLMTYLDKAGFAEHIMIDFSIVSDLDYYNGIIFRGYIPKVKHQYVLSGGRYDKLANKFHPHIGALGFAIYVSELAYPKNENADVDVILLYSDADDPALVDRYAWKLRKEGLCVRTEREVPEGITYNLVKRMEDSDA